VFEIDYPDRCSVALMNSDRSNMVELTPKKHFCENAPSFTPDGARIIFDRFDPATFVHSRHKWEQRFTANGF
jgi:hypothetical protein